ncbi:MAG TPA: M13-type metalloendopeptidase [Caulobacteraceae bacterium]|jgi:putative endopeptidase|nr:M13-type metalloendopeptidase [Caulobacteraceae bacterium]
MKNRLFMSAAIAATLAFGAGAALAHEPNPAPSDQQILFEGVVEGAAADQAAGPQYGPWGFDESGVDPKAKPGDSFFDYANGAWYAKTVIPADRSSYGMSTAIYDRTQEQLRTLIDNAGKAHGSPDSDAGKIGGLYNAFMDEARLEQLDDKPIQPELDRIRAARTKTDMAVIMGRSMGGFGSSFFGNGVGIDAKDSEHYTIYASQSGLGLPDRDYYLSDKFKDKKAAYRDYIAKMLGMIGWPEADKRADDIVAMETAIAEASWSRAESRDRDKTYNATTFVALEKDAPGFAWTAWAQASGLPRDGRVVVAQNTAMPKIAKIFADTPIETLQAWEAFRVVDETSPSLSKRFVDAHFDFRNRTMSGQQEDRPRWKRGVSLVDGSLGEMVGKEYVAQYFPASSKTAMVDLVGQLRLALHGRIERLAWMSPETKAKALQKLDKFGVKIGYPNKWRNYSALKIDPTDLIGDERRSGVFEHNFELSHLGKPVDKDEWGMTPQTVNAYYNPSRNEIVFPAAILQAPFFDPKADMAINFGGIGGVIGHEMTHGFDDQGRKSDGNGNLTDWWTAADAAKFKVQAAKYGAQYDTYFVADGVHVKGDQTMGENIADLGGILLGLDAYHASLHGKPAPVLDGYTGDQRVFLGWAQVWRVKARPDALKAQATSDVHSPARFRVDGPVRNIDAWYAAFGVKPGDKEYIAPEDRARIW